MNRTLRETPALIDNSPLIEMSMDFVSDSVNGFSFHPYDGGAEAERLGFRSVQNRDKQAYVVTAEDTALELGSPRHTSMSTLLWTAEKRTFPAGVWTSGRAFTDIKEPMANLLLVVMAEVPQNYDPGNSQFRSILNFSNRIPGYMARSVPGKQWIRLSDDLINRDFSPLSLGQCLIHAFHDAVTGLGAVAVVVAAGESRLTNAYEPIYNLERIYSGKNRKLSLEASGIIECDDLSCSSCKEKKSCDTIRDIMVIKKTGEKRDKI